jgi:hypothetical protein
VPLDTRDYHDRLWLARALEEAGRSAEAESLLRQTADRFDDVPSVRVALVEFLARADRPTDAAAAVREAEQRLAAPGATVYLARCYEVTGRLAEAEARYQASVHEAPDSAAALRGFAQFHLRHDQPNRARTALLALLSPRLEAPPEVAAWARRELALATAADGTPEAVRDALALLDAAPAPPSEADRRACALVMGMRPERRREALNLFEETVGRQPLTPDEQFRLALLWDAADDCPRARELMFSLLTAHAREPQYLAGQVRMLLARDSLPEARQWLATLEKLEPDSPRTRALKMELVRKAEQATPNLRHRLARVVIQVLEQVPLVPPRRR